MMEPDLELDFMISVQLAMEEEEERPRRAPVSSIVDPQLELSDPNPSAHALFVDFDVSYFGGRLGQVTVDWSSRMTRCAGVCSFQPRSGLCSIRLSAPLLALRPRRDLVETLLHEMIHAYIFIVHHDRDREAHGPVFQSHMHRINAAAGTNITIYHTFHDEVASHQKHWWKCSGPCQHRPPFFGIVKRAMNRAPSARDFWWPQHQRECGGSFVKIKEPEPKKGKGGRISAPAKSSFTVKGGVLSSKSPNGKKREGSDIRDFMSPKTPRVESASSSSSIIQGKPASSSSHVQGKPASSSIIQGKPASSSSIIQGKPALPKGARRPSVKMPSSQTLPGRQRSPHKVRKPPETSQKPPRDVRTSQSSNSGSQLFKGPASQPPNVRTIQSSDIEAPSKERFPGLGKTLGGAGNGRSRLLSLYAASKTS